MLLDWKDGDVHSLAWLNKRGIDRKMAYKYGQSGYIEKLGGGVYLKGNGKKNWMAIISALQMEMELHFHVGGKTSLELHGLGHYGNLSDRPTVYIFTNTNSIFPRWVLKHNWGANFVCKRSSLFLDNTGIDLEEFSGHSIKVSSRERAILEFIDLLDLSNSFETAENYMEGLRTLRSDLVQQLLERCSSIKVKRVFLYLAKKIELPVFKKIVLDKINLGSGKRVIFHGGVLDKTYNITVPGIQKENPY